MFEQINGFLLNRTGAKKRQARSNNQEVGGWWRIVSGSPGPNVSKYWRMAYRSGGKQKLLALGVYPNVSIAKARKTAQQAKEQLAEGVDPGLVKKIRKGTNATDNTFLAVEAGILLMQLLEFILHIQRLVTLRKIHTPPSARPRRCSRPIPNRRLESEHYQAAPDSVLVDPNQAVGSISKPARTFVPGH
jgi:hypothetical protein